MVTAPCTNLFTLRDGSERILVIARHVADYYGIEDIRPKMTIAHRQSYTYQRSRGLDTSETTEVRVGRSDFVKVPTVNGKRGRKIRVPTELLTPRGYTKTLGITFPYRADYQEIGQWLFTNCKNHRPRYFIGVGGGKYLVYDFARLGEDEPEV